MPNLSSARIGSMEGCSHWKNKSIIRFADVFILFSNKDFHYLAFWSWAKTIKLLNPLCLASIFLYYDIV